VRQSTMTQVRENTESLKRQYELVERAHRLGWPADRVRVVDDDLGCSGAEATAQRFKITKPTVYKWVDRFAEGSVAALENMKPSGMKWRMSTGRGQARVRENS
jgi:hypothetical protein